MQTTLETSECDRERRGRCWRESPSLSIVVMRRTRWKSKGAAQLTSRSCGTRELRAIDVLLWDMARGFCPSHESHFVVCA
jgi:hypothetical protein